MVVSRRAKFVTPGSVSLVTLCAAAMAPLTPTRRTTTNAYRFSMMGAMVGQPSHEAPYALRACAPRFDRVRPAGRRASGSVADYDDGAAHRRLHEHEGSLGVPAQPAHRQNARQLEAV